MKRHTTMKLSAALLCAAFVVGCQDQGSSPVGPEGLGPQLHHRPGHGGGPGGDPEPDFIPLEVTFSDRTGDGVLSDAVIGGSLVYTDGVDKVSAHLRGNNGHFRLFTAFDVKKRQEPIRKLCFDFGPGAAGILGSFDADGKGCDGNNPAGPVGMVTSNALDGTGAAFPGGMLGMEPGSVITMAASTYFEVDGFGWRLRYGRDCDGNLFESDDPSRLTVTGGADSGTDGLSDAWTIEASGPAILCKTPLKGKGGTTEVDQFNMPFELTAVRQ